MENSMLETKSIKVATKVIIHSGNARVKVNEAADYIEKFYFDAAEKKLEEAEAEITAAHGIQTDIIQAESRGEKLELSLLIVHAQDTLMTVISEKNMMARMLKLFKRFHSKFSEKDS